MLTGWAVGHAIYVEYLITQRDVIHALSLFDTIDRFIFSTAVSTHSCPLSMVFQESLSPLPAGSQELLTFSRYIYSYLTPYSF
jgi:hypothetical protein